MAYRFYGWENAACAQLGNRYPGITSPRALYDALSLLWCRQTCAPRMRKDWTQENPTLGQCSVTAFLCQDIFGGEVRGIALPDGSVHCYNVVGDCVFDLTSEQFGKGVLDYSENPIQSREAHFAKQEKARRYEYLCALLDGFCRFGIRRLPKKDWKGTPILMRYTTDTYFDVVIEEEEDKMRVVLEKKRFESPVTHTPEEYDYPDKLYQDHWEDADAWGIAGKDGTLLACIETCPERWSNRLMVTELWVHESLRRKGVGTRLMDIAKGETELMGNRALILEMQSCNTAAFAFYRAQGYHLAGFDSCCYTNSDIARKEVRLDLAWFPEEWKGKTKRFDSESNS